MLSSWLFETRGGHADRWARTKSISQAQVSMLLTGGLIIKE